MTTLQQQACMLEALSERLLRCGLTHLWRAIFLRQGAGPVEFQERPFTLVCSDDPAESLGDPVVSMIAHTYRGLVQYGSELPVVLSFDEPVDALRAALALHRLAHGSRLRTAVTTGAYVAAVLEIEGLTRTLLLGDTLAAAERQAMGALPGSIRISPEAYSLVHADIAANAPDAMVMTEVEGDAPSPATLWLPPSRASDHSTFAGLGRT